MAYVKHTEAKSTSKGFPIPSARGRGGGGGGGEGDVIQSQAQSRCVSPKFSNTEPSHLKYELFVCLSFCS